MDVVFVHGAGGGAWEWAIWQRVFAAHGLASRAIELVPGPHGLALTRLSDYAAQLVRFARRGPADPGTRTVLVGASLGGLVALAVSNELAAHALVLVNPVPPAPWHELLPPHVDRGEVIPWRRDATLAGTRRALPDADDAACRLAWRRWRDESGAVVAAARAGVVVASPRGAMRVVASSLDRDVPACASIALAAHHAAGLDLVAGASHVGPLLGRSANATADRAAAWLRSAARGATSAQRPSTRASRT